ncbi:hypothetical protein D3C84_881390 [compost metagenome]
MANVEDYLTHRFKQARKPLGEVMDASGVQAVIDRLSDSGRDNSSQLYPLAIGNLVTAAMNLAAELGEPLVTHDVVKGV